MDLKRFDYYPSYKSAREGLGLSLKDAAAAIGVTPVTLSKWERGITKPTVTPLIRMHVLYGVPVSKLVGIEA